MEEEAPAAKIDIIERRPGGRAGRYRCITAWRSLRSLQIPSQGLSHGHYDKLSYSFHDNGDEIIQDYGLVRFVNIGQKGEVITSLKTRHGPSNQSRITRWLSIKSHI